MPEISPELLQLYGKYFDPTGFSSPANLTKGGSGVKDTLIKGLSMGDPVFGSLFGGDKPSWKPYIDAQGKYVWTNPKSANPVPVASVPGAKLKPQKAYRKMANQVQAIVDLLPAYSQAVSGQIVPNALGTLAAQQATAPGLAELMTRIYGTYGPQLNEIGNAIARVNALDQVERDSAALERSRSSLIPQALEAAKLYDPEYFSTRELASSRLKDLLDNIDLTSGLSDVERREIAQSQAQEGTRRGTYNAPSNLATVSNALQYGQAGFNRLQTNRNALSQAIAGAVQALPAMKSGVDVFQVATGKSSFPNTGDARFTGIPNVNSEADRALNIGQQLGSNAQGIDLTNMQINASKKDWLDKLNQITSSVGNIVGAAGSIAGLCWIARKVFGEDDYRWKDFRYWLVNQAPLTLYSLYASRGKMIADKLTNTDLGLIKLLMERILNYV